MIQGFRRFVTLATAMAALAGSPAPVDAADVWPSRPIKVVVPYPAGGGADPVMRAWGEKLHEVLGQPWVIENRGGASGTIGTEAVVRAAPDGYTFLVTPNAPITVVGQFRPLNYDALKDLVPVARVGDIVSGFTVRADAPFDTIAGMVDYARKHPGKLAYGSPGPGSATHMRLEVLKLRSGADITYVPYKGSAEALSDILAGNIQIMQDPSVYPHVRAGRLKILAVNNPVRMPTVPDVPTLTEAGYPNADIPIWMGMFAPAGTPPDIVQKLNRTIVALADDKELAKRLLDAGMIAPKQTPAEMAAFMREDAAATAAVIRDAHIKLE